VKKLWKRFVLWWLNDEFTAYHEAGHAVVGIKFGRKVEAITIEREDNKWQGRVLFARMPHVDAWLKSTPVPAPTPEILTFVENSVASLYAGPIAEAMRYKGRGKYVEATAINDLEKVKNLRTTFFKEEDADKFYKQAADRAADALVEEWPRVKKLAEALLWHRTLTGEQVEAILT
jgi:hypothetical protein